MDYPKITIITPSYNQGQFLEETILSVLGQNYPNLEYFVIDGGSTDNSVEIIKKYESKINYWVSEKDNGQSEAINKGLKRATGEIINWINSDDMHTPGSLHHVAEKFKETNALCVCGPITMFRDEKKWEFESAYNSGESMKSVFGRDSFNQPGTFFHRDVIAKMGLPDQRLHFVMDKEWFIRFLLYFGTDRIAVTDKSLALYRFHDSAKTVAQAKKFFDEYAALVYRVTEAAGENELLPLMSEKFDFSQHDYRFSKDIPKPVTLFAHQMTALLLLRRFHKIFNEQDFIYTSKLNKAIRWNEIELDANLTALLAQMQKSLSYGWFFFRVRRKLGLASKY
jgi:glycosyltransferase involved in cell wall biosynthesis